MQVSFGEGSNFYVLLTLNITHYRQVNVEKNEVCGYLNSASNHEQEIDS